MKRLNSIAVYCAVFLSACSIVPNRVEASEDLPVVEPKAMTNRIVELLEEVQLEELAEMSLEELAELEELSLKELAILEKAAELVSRETLEASGKASNEALVEAYSRRLLRELLARRVAKRLAREMTKELVFRGLAMAEALVETPVETSAKITMFGSTRIGQRTYAHSEPNWDGTLLIIVTPAPSMQNINDIVEPLTKYAEGIDCSKFWKSDLSELEINERLHSDVFTKGARGIVNLTNPLGIFHANCTH